MQPSATPPRARTADRRLGVRWASAVLLGIGMVAVAASWTGATAGADRRQVSPRVSSSSTSSSTTSTSTSTSATSTSTSTTTVASEVAATSVVDEQPLDRVIDTGLELADPTILTAATGYVAAGTQMEHDGELLNVPAAVSTDLSTWTGYVDLLPELPTWASEGFTWAPSLVPLGDGYELYFAALDAASGRLCIGVATSDRPLGPFRSNADAPLVCQAELGGSIDPEVVDTGGRRWLLWKNDGNCCDLEVHIWAQQLDTGALIGRPQAVLAADAGWEGGVVENPAARFVDGELVLYYSGNAWDSADYGIGVATCVGDWLHCTKSSRSSAAMEDAEGTGGSGGASVFVDVDGTARMVWHAWSVDESGNLARTAYIGAADVAA